MKPRRIRIRGHWWRLVFKRPPVKETLQGLCDYATRTIYVSPKSEDPLATLVHETLHASLPDLDEDAVEGTEEALMKALCLFP